MSDQITGSIDPSPMQKLIDVMQDYMTLTGKPSSKALAKAAREVDFQMLTSMRVQPPRPTKGAITAATRARGFTLTVRATARAQATKLLGQYKSGYFVILEKAGVVTAQPVYLGKRGRAVKTSRNGAKLVTSRDQVSIPQGALKLNWWGLAELLELKLREKAAAGGYMAQEFQTFKALDRGNVESATYYTKDHKGVGSVSPGTNSVTISGYVPNAAKIAAKYGIVDKALSQGADAYRVDMLEYVLDRNTKLLASLGAFN